MQFLYFYVHGPDNGLELRCSIRSIGQNFVGDAYITVIGDKPSWYKGHHIPLAPVSGKTQVGTSHSSRHRPARPIYRVVPEQRRQFLDTQHKIWTAVNHPELQDEFVWIMDDVYLLRPTTIEDLKVPRFDPWYRRTLSKEWHRQIEATFVALRSKGKRTLQFGTHLPHHLEKSKLLELFQVYDYPRKLYLFEILYGNHFRTGEQPYGGNWQGVEYQPFLKRLLKRPHKISDMDGLVANSNVLNYQAVAYNPQMKAWLEGRFPSPSSCE